MAKIHRLESSKLSRENIEVARRLRRVRESEDFSLSEFAREIGIERSTLANYEYGITALPYAAAMQICARLELSPRWLATGAEPRAPFVSTDEIKISGLSVEKRATFVEVYRAELAGKMDAWFSTRAKEIQAARRVRLEPTRMFRPMSSRKIVSFLREWVSALRAELEPYEQRAIIDKLAAALAELRARTVSAAGQKKVVDETVQIGQLTGMQIATELKKARKALDMTQEEAAKHWGIPVSTLRKWEGKFAKPRGLALRQLETILQTAEQPPG